MRTFTLSGAGDGNIVVARLNAAGQWTQAVEVRSRNCYDFQGSTLALNANGDVVVAGSFSGGQVTFGPCSLTAVTRRVTPVAGKRLLLLQKRPFPGNQPIHRVTSVI
ncbi:hypothetical protein GCM10011495_12780 [Hymenobacter frigidus]|uniref:Uncharacterized protein n=1 Tax=Hymenobacter frigidus TaxID=1524095 RepID=A0ABQ1ZZK1_9BACT|nr:hypothetical protein [Hymenobacter frigidus]GGH83287.1 hypothetical protein GCM10011495_12780 [Hymenobacter frigidus]